MELQDKKRIELLIEDNHSLRDSSRAAIAFHSPEKLKEEELDWKRRAGLLESNEEALERAKRQVEELAKIEGL